MPAVFPASMMTLKAGIIRVVIEPINLTTEVMTMDRTSTRVNSTTKAIVAGATTARKTTHGVGLLFFHPALKKPRVKKNIRV